jgi:hypothetical protein
VGKPCYIRHYRTAQGTIRVVESDSPLDRKGWLTRAEKAFGSGSLLPPQPMRPGVPNKTGMLK